MPPPEKVELIIVRLSFLPYINPSYPRISTTRKKHSPSGSITQVRDWFDRTISQEKRLLPPNVNVRYTEWRILTGNINLFTIEHYRFDKILLVLGEENNYWIYYQNMPMHRRLEGSGRLPIAFCSCCLSQQYLKIMEKVKEATLKNEQLVV